MIDVLVNPGAPEPWLVQQKETAVLNPVLSSKEVLSRLSLNNFLFIDDSSLQSSVHCSSTVDSAKRRHDYSQPYRKRRKLHWQNPPTMDTQTQCFSSTRANSNMASWQGSLAHDYSCREKIIPHEALTSSSSFQNQYTSNAYHLTAPIMRTTHSSSGISVSVQTAPGSVDLPGKVFTTVKIDGSQELPQSMAGSEPNWPSETPPSFGSGTESSPSLSSSFEFLEVPKEDPVPYGLPLSDGAFIDHPPNKALVSESQDTPFLENSSSTTSFQWSMSTGNDSWNSQYHPDALVWSAPTAMTSSSWSMPEHAGIIPDIQLVAPHNFTHNSLLSPHNNASIPSAPMPDEPNCSSVNSLEIGASQIHSFNNLPQYSGLPPISNYSTSFPGSSTTYPVLLQQQLASPAIKANLHYSDTRNALLIEWKRAGLSYKEIKRIGGFKEAESTLRGRFRTLTKAKEHRVRKPKWLKRDVQLLCEAVAAYAEQVSPPGAGYASLAQANMALAMTGQPPKVSWKKVAQYIWSHGGSYQFGNATCKKKWCDIHGIKI